MEKVLILALVIGLFSCKESLNKQLSEKDSKEQADLVEVGDEESEISFEDEVAFANFCFVQLEEGNVERLRPFTEGSILFSPYAFIDLSTVRTATLDEISDHTEDVYYWGDYDGSGDSILLTLPEYLNKYVLTFNINDEVVKTNIYSGKPKAYGSELHNMHEVFPKARFVEFYYPPSEEGYLDWNALVFVVEEINNQYQLKAIIHNQWTV